MILRIKKGSLYFLVGDRQEVLGVDEPHDFVDVLGGRSVFGRILRRSRPVPGPAGEAVIDRGNDVGPGNHHLGSGRLREQDRACQQLAGEFLDHTLLTSGGDDGRQILGGVNCLQFITGFHSEDSEDEVG